MTLRDKLIVLRDKAGISQMTLAEQLGVSRQAISRWESGDTTPTMDNLKALAKIYDVSLDWLCSENTDVTDQQKPAEEASVDEICEEDASSTKKMQNNCRSTVVLSIGAVILVLACMWFAVRNKKADMKNQSSTDVKYDVIDLPSQNDNRFIIEWED